jgi:hypothetical protein
MIVSEELYTLPCHKCEYNFCTKCVETFVRSSKDDYQVASDGSRQVKVHVCCPQCRSHYDMDISKLLLLRRAHSLGSSIVDQETGTRHGDSQLTATQLSMKRDFSTHRQKRKVEQAHGMYLQVMDGKISSEIVHDAELVWKRLFAGIPEPEGDQDDDDDDDDESDEEDSAKQDRIDLTLFQGLEDCMGRDEAVFLTQLLTSGQASKLSQAAMILHGILKLSLTSTSASMLSRLSIYGNSSSPKSKADLMDRTKAAFPLPCHMPGYFVIPAYSKAEKFLSLDDLDWDGSIIPPQRSKRVFDKVYGEYYHPPNSAPHQVVLVKSVRGPAGRVGLRRADVVSHINDMEWTGPAIELQAYIYQMHERNPNDEITLTVNANPETASFLQIRDTMMKNSRLELI